MAKLKSPKNKGSGYERELASHLNERLGLDCKRTVLSGGGFLVGDSDLTGTPHIWVEAKRTEKFSPYAAMEQAEKGLEGRERREAPVVISRRNRMKTGESLVVMRLDQWLEFYQAYLNQSA